MLMTDPSDPRSAGTGSVGDRSPSGITIVTGANTGIGRVTAIELARLGHRVVVACRSEDRAAAVLEAIAALPGVPPARFLALDLADLRSVAAAAAELRSRDEPVNLLVANAGLAGQRGLTAQGFELAFGVNHLGHFLFVTELLDLAVAGAPARVIVVSSDSHRSAKGIPFDRLQRRTRSVTGLREYGVSKLANVLFAEELARRYEPTVLATASVHPGVVATEVWRRVPGPVRAVMTRRMRTPVEGARTSIDCATTLPIEQHSGAYWTDSERSPVSPVATVALAEELWDRSEAWVAPYR